MWLSDNPEYQEFFAKKNQENERFFSGNLTKTELNAIVNEKLNYAVQYVINNSIYGERLFAQWRGIQITRDSLHTLPYTEKDLLRELQADSFCTKIDNAHYYYETTGTTGRTVPALRDPYDRMWVNSNWYYGWGALTKQHKSARVGIMGPSELHGMVDTFTDIFHRLGCCVLKIYPFSTKVDFKKAIQVISDLKLDTLCMTPSVALLIAKACRKYGIDMVRSFSVRTIYLTGEMCTPAMCRNIESFYNCRAYNNPFGSQETLALGIANIDGDMCTLPQSYIYQLIDLNNGQPIDGYGTGELVVTMIERGSRPLIRYRSGDLVKLEPPTSTSNIPSDVIVPLGRVSDQIKFDHISLSAYTVEMEILSPLKQCLSYQMKVTDRTKHGVDIVIEVEMYESNTITSAHQIQIREAFSEKFGLVVDIQEIPEARRETSTGAFSGWKSARIQDLRGEDNNDRYGKELAARFAESRTV